MNSFLRRHASSISFSYRCFDRLLLHGYIRALYRLAVLYQKLYHRLYAPLTASTLAPLAGDNVVPNARKRKLDRLYEAVDKALRQLSEGVGIAA